jgi:hypothetical protein
VEVEIVAANGCNSEQAAAYIKQATEPAKVSLNATRTFETARFVSLRTLHSFCLRDSFDAVD